MTLNEAIARFQELINLPMPGSPPEDRDIYIMALAALSRIRHRRLNPAFSFNALLPGETKVS